VHTKYKSKLFSITDGATFIHCILTCREINFHAGAKWLTNATEKVDKGYGCFLTTQNNIF